jgi:hypothetical protein
MELSWIQYVYLIVLVWLANGVGVLSLKIPSNGRRGTGLCMKRVAIWRDTYVIALSCFIHITVSMPRFRRQEHRMVFEFIRQRAEEGFAQVQNLATKTIKGKLSEALSESSDYIRMRQKIDTENLSKLAEGRGCLRRCDALQFFTLSSSQVWPGPGYGF